MQDFVLRPCWTAATLIMLFSILDLFLRLKIMPLIVSNRFRGLPYLRNMFKSIFTTTIFHFYKENCLTWRPEIGVSKFEEWLVDLISLYCGLTYTPFSLRITSVLQSVKISERRGAPDVISIFLIVFNHFLFFMTLIKNIFRNSVKFHR